LPGLTRRAYADDIAVVTENLAGDIQQLHTVYSQFREISAMSLNVKKCVVVPLAPGRIQQTQVLIKNRVPEWATMQVDAKANYLGFVLGPGKGESSWSKPLRKYAERAKDWEDQPGGMFVALMAHRIYAISTLSFVIQLEPLPSDWAEIEKATTGKVLRGFRAWGIPYDLKILEELGFPTCLPDMRAMQWAAKLRVARWEDAASGGLRVRERASQLRTAVQSSECLRTAGEWANWFRTGFVVNLAEAILESKAHGVDTFSVLAKAVGSPNGPWTQPQWQQARNRFQKSAYKLLIKLPEAGIEERLRHKLDRWDTGDFGRVKVARARKMLKWLGKEVPPRIWAAVWRALWNGWATRRRTQGRHGLDACAFCDSEYGDDSLEHYAHCRPLHDCAGRQLRLTRPNDKARRVADFLMLCDAEPAQHRVANVARAIRLAATYRVHCAAACGQVARGAAAVEGLSQAIKEVVAGHAAERILDQMFVLRDA